MRQLNRRSKQQQVFFYALYANGVPFVVTVIAILIDLDDKYISDAFKPGIGIQKCFLKGLTKKEYRERERE